MSRPTKTCGCRQAGILIDAETLEIMACDECALFASDFDASAAVGALLKHLGTVYDESGDDQTVADALEAVVGAQALPSNDDSPSADGCVCCPSCSAVPCAGCEAGGICDAMRCRCFGEDDPDDDRSPDSNDEPEVDGP